MAFVSKLVSDYKFNTAEITTLFGALTAENVLHIFYYYSRLTRRMIYLCRIYLNVGLHWNLFIVTSVIIIVVVTIILSFFMSSDT